MSRSIAVQNADGGDDYVVAYYVLNDDDIEWLISLQPIDSGTNG